MESIPFHYDDGKIIGTNQEHVPVDCLITVYIRLDRVMLHYDQWHRDFLTKVYEIIRFYLTSPLSTTPGSTYLLETVQKKKS